MKTRLLTTLVLLISTASAATHSTLALRHRESEGVGYNKGYSTLDYYLTSQLDNLEILLNIRGHLFNDAKGAANAGIGFRYSLNDDSSRIGTNLYYDVRDTKHFFAHQTGAGLEWLSKNIDVRVNGYIPVGKIRNFSTHRFQGFSGNQVHVKQKFTAALPSLEGEIGTQLANPFYFAVGSYYLFRETSRSLRVGDAFGYKVRFDVDIGRYVTLGALVTYDHIFKTRAQGYVAITIPFGPWKGMKDVTCQYEKRRIVRNEIIPIQSKKRSRTPLTINDSDPAQFVFVNNLAQALGDGTFERPFKTLKEAEAFSKPGDVIYVFPGDGTPHGMDEGIILKDDQILVSSASTFELDKVIIPAQTPGEIPVITNIHPNAPVITNPGKTELHDFFYMDPWEYMSSFNAPSFDTPSISLDPSLPYSDPSLADWVIMGHSAPASAGGLADIIADYQGDGRE